MARASAPPRPLTADEREALRRHAINLRMGALSQGGEIETTDADVERLFTELIPAEIEARKAQGQKARILFYAHGGLIGEREGLEPVLRRLKFWRQNNVYPISFVWETGLRESVMDIVGGLGRHAQHGRALDRRRPRRCGAGSRRAARWQGRLEPDEAQRGGGRARRRRRAAHRRSHARAVEHSTTPTSRFTP